MAGNRKTELKSLFAGGPLHPAGLAPAPEVKSGGAGDELTGVNTAHAAEPAPGVAPVAAPSHQRAASGAVRAMGLSLGAITREAEEARHLRQALSEGERVVLLDPALVQSSFIADRMTDGVTGDPDFAALIDSIRDNGQQAPILVRPHPTLSGHYETAYGHRRLGAVRALGRKVQALVRPLTDDQLVVAQGKENAERRNLSFIERALFAHALGERGFERKVIAEALAVDKTELSRLFQVADGVPMLLARAIGPAPKVGRTRWMQLATLMTGEADRYRAMEEVRTDAAQAADSDQRFALVLARLQRARRAEPPAPLVLTDARGRAVARVTRGRRTTIEVLDDADAGLIDAIAALIAQRP